LPATQPRGHGVKVLNLLKFPGPTMPQGTLPPSPSNPAHLFVALPILRKTTISPHENPSPARASSGLGVDNHGIAAQAQPQPTPTSQSPGLLAQTARPENKAACSKLPGPNALHLGLTPSDAWHAQCRESRTQAGMRHARSRLTLTKLTCICLCRHHLFFSTWNACVSCLLWKWAWIALGWKPKLPKQQHSSLRLDVPEAKLRMFSRSNKTVT
jgi:hypothetical protein